jgi:diaminohydroxyphosphoribosylaminopyrimidine deaminase/5-amino-6-(5-phosphoribosylamino)uracil reductase
MYVSLEPCAHHGRQPPCVEAILEAGIARVVYASDDPSEKAAGRGPGILRDGGVDVEQAAGPEAALARQLNQPFRKHARSGLPLVTLKMASSLDGFVAAPSGDARWISGERSRELVHRWRASSDAVAVGIGTALADDPLLTCRLPGMADRSPVRVVLDSALRLPPDGQLAMTARETPLWILAAEAAPKDRELVLAARGIEVLRLPSPDGRIDLTAALKLLAERGITRLLVESGPILSAAFLNADLVDEAALYRSPKPIGSDGIDAIEGLSLDALTRSPHLVSTGSEPVGDDTVELFERR